MMQSQSFPDRETKTQQRLASDTNKNGLKQMNEDKATRAESIIIEQDTNTQMIEKHLDKMDEIQKSDRNVGSAADLQVDSSNCEGTATLANDENSSLPSDENNSDGISRKVFVFGVMLLTFIVVGSMYRRRMKRCIVNQAKKRRNF